MALITYIYGLFFALFFFQIYTIHTSTLLYSICNNIRFHSVRTSVDQNAYMSIFFPSNLIWCFLRLHYSNHSNHKFIDFVFLIPSFCAPPYQRKRKLWTTTTTALFVLFPFCRFVCQSNIFVFNSQRKRERERDVVNAAILMNIRNRTHTHHTRMNFSLLLALNKYTSSAKCKTKKNRLCEIHNYSLHTETHLLYILYIYFVGLHQ